MARKTVDCVFILLPSRDSGFFKINISCDKLPHWTNTKPRNQHIPSLSAFWTWPRVRPLSKMFEGMIRWKHHRHHFFLWSCVFRRNTGVSFSVGLSEGSCKRNISQTEFSLPSWSMNLVLCYRNFFRFASFSTLLDALHQKDCLTQSHGIHGYTHGSVDRQHQSSRFMDVAFVAMRIWHFHRNKAHRPPEEPLISGVFFGVLWCVGRRICECFWHGWLQMDIGFMMNYDKCI